MTEKDISKKKPPLRTLHTDEQLGPLLTKIANHPYLELRKNDPTGAGALWQLRVYDDPGDLRQILDTAIADRALPADLRELILTYMVQFGDEALGEMIEGSEQYAVGQFNGGIEQLSRFGWEPARLVAAVMYFTDSEPDPEFIHAVEDRLAELAAEDEDEDEDEDDEPEAAATPLSFPTTMQVRYTKEEASNNKDATMQVPYTDEGASDKATTMQVPYTVEEADEADDEYWAQGVRLPEKQKQARKEQK